MLIVPEKPFRRRRSGKRPMPPLAGAPVLIAAAYLAATWVRLTFDRPVSAGPIESDELFVDDRPAGIIWTWASITVLAPQRLQMALTEYDTSSGSVVTLSASATTGIVSAFDGAAWAGVTDVQLPFP
ncbi:MAG: hypothetical protein WBD40_13805 [Tepidisphaeraceae bacterium]